MYRNTSVLRAEFSRIRNNNDENRKFFSRRNAVSHGWALSSSRKPRSVLIQSGPGCGALRAASRYSSGTRNVIGDVGGLGGGGATATGCRGGTSGTNIVPPA